MVKPIAVSCLHRANLLSIQMGFKGMKLTSLTEYNPKGRLHFHL